MGLFKKTKDKSKGGKDGGGVEANNGSAPTTSSDSGAGNAAVVGAVIQGPLCITVATEKKNSLLPALNQPEFKDVPLSARKDLFVTKMQACQRMFVWQDGVEPADDPQWAEKEKKRKQLVSLVDFINLNTKGTFDEENMPEVVAFVSTNLFRPFLANPVPPHVQYDPEEDEPMPEPCWLHLQFVMEFFLRFVVNTDVDPKVAKRHIDQKFILKLIDLFQSEDNRERDFLKTILHRIYGKFMQHRSFIRKSINNVFYHFVYNTHRHNGVAELLEILGSIINGFALPLKEEHKNFLRNVLLPLHKARTVAMYHNQLSYCVTQFCEKDPALCPEIIQGIIRFWPHTNSPKEVLLLHQLEEILELTPHKEMCDVIVPLFTLINRCILSLHFQVAERVLFFWNNEYILQFMETKKEEVLPMVFPSLMQNTRGHWNPTVYTLTIKVVKIFNEMDPKFFEECAQTYKDNQSKIVEKTKERDQVWTRIEGVATKTTGGSADFFKPKLVREPSLLEREFKVEDIKTLVAKNAEKNHPNFLKDMKERGVMRKSVYLSSAHA